jgi:pimeloyl-ACP methyl ester carboxylesterase
MSAAPVRLDEIAGLKTGVCVVGDGRPVLALHGWGGSIQSFWPVAERLAPKGYQVHLLDLPGFGQSELPPTTWGVGDYAAFILAYLDGAQIDRTALIGHSFGGRISLMLAADHSAWFSRMVLAAGAGIRTPPSLRQMMRSGVSRTVRKGLTSLHMDGLRDRLRESYNQRYASEDFLTAGPLRETFIRVIEEDLTAYAERVPLPTLLIWGDQDQETPLWQGRRFEQIMPDAGLVVFTGAGHFAYLERLSETVHIVDHFLGGGE